MQTKFWEKIFSANNWLVTAEEKIFVFPGEKYQERELRNRQRFQLRYDQL